MSEGRPIPVRSLRRRILVTSSLGVVIGGGGLAALFALNTRAQDRLFAATDAVMEEHAIADRITEAVMRQLLAVSTLQASGVPSLSTEFRSAGDVVQAEIRTYLFRDLSTDERIRLESVKEAHQRLEVAAARATELFARGEVREGGGSSEAMLSHAHGLLDELTEFLAMRKEQLQRDRLQQIRAVRITYGAWVAVALVLLFGSLALGRFLHRRVAAPLSVLAAAARRIGGGDLTLRVPEDFDAEFSELARSFNRMSEGLTELTADLEGRNTELLEALQHVQAAQAELLQAEKLGAMGRMMAGLAHELNNPLASVLGFGELLALRLAEDRDPRLEEINQELVVPILDEARRAHDLVHSLLQFARKSDPALGPVRVRESLDVVVRLREFAFTQAGLALEIGEVPDVHVVGERQRLQEIFLNITNNALDAMKGAGRGTLRITGTSEGDFFVLRFDDEGPGLAQPDRVFEPFFTTKPPGEGTGLGLALVQKFTEEFGGTVRAARAPQGGASFVLRFRTAEAPLNPPLHPAADLDSPKGLATVVDRAPRVLVVEDEPNLRRLQQRILAGIGADVLLASDAAEARRLLNEHEVDLVVSDVKMPGETGLSLFRWVTLAHPHLTDHFFFVTGDTGDPEIISLVQEHPDMFICKPFEMKEYTARVALFLGRPPSSDAGS